MAVSLITSRRALGDRPLGPVALNRDSLYRRGLLGTWVTNGARGLYDLVSNQAISYSANPPSLVSGALRFDAVSAGATSPISFTPTPATGGMTIATWYRMLTTTSGTYRTISSGPSGNWLMGGYSGTYQCYKGDGFIDSTVAVTTTPVFHVVTDDTVFGVPGTLRQYVNGVAAGTGAFSQSPQQICFGAGGTFADPGNCDVLSLSVWNRVLTPNEVWALYEPNTRWDLYWVPSRRTYVNIAAAPPAGNLSRLTLLGVG